MNKDLQFRLKAVESYFRIGSLRKTAQKLSIPYQTLHRWVKWFKEGGKENLEREKFIYRKPWNRISPDIEKIIVSLKEREPAITVRKAREKLEKKGIRISIKGIWNVWKRYGYAGFKKENLSNEWTESCELTVEAARKLKKAQSLFKKGKIKEASEILNSIPFLPRNELILKIPDSFLNLRRLVEKHIYQFGQIPPGSYLENTRKLITELEKRKMYYSMLRTEITEIITLEWLGEPYKQIKKINRIKKLIKKFNGYYSYLLFEPLFTLSVSEAICYAVMGNIDKARKIMSICKKLLRQKKTVSPYFLFDMGSLCMNLEEYREAEHWFKKCLDGLDSETKKIAEGYLFNISMLKGNFHKVNKSLKKIEWQKWVHNSWFFLFQALYALTKGSPYRAIELSQKSLNLLKKGEIKRGIFTNYLTIACTYSGIGETEKAKEILKNTLIIIKKLKLKKEETIIKLLLQKKEKYLKKENIFPSVKLILLLNSGRYEKAYFYSKNKYLIPHFYRYITFYPELIGKRIKNRKPTFLPKSILRLPVFKKETITFHIQFLGKLKIYRIEGKEIESVTQKERIKFSLTPKQKALLIHLALRIPEPGRIISLDSLYKNFWKNSKNPSKNLSQLLTKLRKQLRIPSHFLEVSRKGEKPVLKNNGIYFITDYFEFREKIAGAGALLRAGQWELAKREFISAFRLVRGEPFLRMYDRWSEDLRLGIIFEIEKEMIKFIEECKNRNELKIARKIFQKGKKIFKYSDKFKEL